jgi:prepilin-type N-terminal cleavage/methylation domain-containing protein
MRHPRASLHRRSGYTLIEMILVIAAVTMVMGLAATLLAAMFKVERGGRHAVNDADTVARLARRFRADAHAAESFQPRSSKPGETGCELRGADGDSVAYRLDGERLRREHKSRGKVLDRESYDVTRLGPVAFGWDGHCALLSLPRRVELGTAVARPPLQIEAVIGKNARLSATISKTNAKETP